MVLAFGGEVGGLGFLFGVEAADVLSDSAELDFCLPFLAVFVPNDSKNSRLAIPMGVVLIPKILGIRPLP